MQYNTETKEAIVKQVFNKESLSLAEIAKRNNVPPSTLDGWVKQAQLKALGNASGGEAGRSVSSLAPLGAAERLDHLLATSSLSEVELGAYCRQHGLYSFQLTDWKKEFIMSDTPTQKTTESVELKALRLENKRLRSDLERKDKALAEASALLILKKKAQAIWGDPEDDYSPPSNGNKP
jgi:transposase